MTSRNIVYTEAQIDAYLARINFPTSVAKPTSDNITTQYGLDYLRRLQKYHMQACPFENLNLHYTQTIVKSLVPKDLYHKFVVRRWGGTCTENNKFFGIIMRSLGFRVRPIGGRVHMGVATGSPDAGYGGWNHCLNLASFDGKKYLIDVAMGPTTPAQPMPLDDGIVLPGIGLSKCRLRYDTIPDYLDSDCKLWIFEQNNEGKSDFVPTYCFSELEFLAADYDVMKAGTTFDRRSWFTWRIVVTRTVLDENEDVVGSVILVNDSIKRRVGGKTKHIATLKHEGERISALKEWFGIELDDDEKAGILGMVSALPDAPIVEPDVATAIAVASTLT